MLFYVEVVLFVDYDEFEISECCFFFEQGMCVYYDEGLFGGDVQCCFLMFGGGQLFGEQCGYQLCCQIGVEYFGD